MPCNSLPAGCRWTRRAALKGAAAICVAIEGFRGSAAEANDLHVGATAPPAMLTTLDGATIATPDLLGHVVVLTFWATWCAPCREELPLLSEYAAHHADAGLRILGFCLDAPDNLVEVNRVARSLSFPSGLMAQSRAPGYGRIWRLPVNFAIDRAGRLVYDGWKDKKPSWTAERLEEVVTPLLMGR
jgi:cytochrome c biogenesis protein CcmG, thiol:disulfide interchange protein DsbE